MPSTHPWQLHCDYLWDRCGSGSAPVRPRIWIAGCGTFQPYVFATANPRADIVATDLSHASLAHAQRRCRVHRIRNVSFAPCDLNDSTTWPQGEFDLIECYGVLMNLPDPSATLRALATRLSPRGVLRVMVYPQFSRSRIFQLQRLARLCGLHANDRSHPARFRALVRSLPAAHPLAYAFANYEDSKNDAGIVDGFLHAGDRGFTGLQLGELIEGAGLQPAFWFHRPWAQPERMAEQLGLAHATQSLAMHYLDAWQELRTNFVVCLRRADAPARQRGPERAHPTFASAHGSLRHAVRLQRLRMLGGRVPTRTGDGDIVLRPAHARALAGSASNRSALRDSLLAEGLWLGGPLPEAQRAAHGATADLVCAAPNLRIGARAPNPLYAHLFTAFELAERLPELRLPDLETQVARWRPWAAPLESSTIRFGLTPHHTYRQAASAIHEHLAARTLPTADHWDAVRLRHDAARLQQMRAWLADSPAATTQGQTDAELRELWNLVCGYESLFVSLDGA